jgi:hypothetical protein
VLRPPEREQPRADPYVEQPPKEGFFQGIANEFGQYKTQFFWLFLGVGVFCFLLLVLLCCSCGFFLPIDTR